MSASDEPRWKCLPHDPKAFFGLSPGFQRTELKRSYNKLIKKYKPEKAPQEFQKIRAAFESLDNELRYGAQAAGLASVFSSNVSPTRNPSPRTQSPDASGAAAPVPSVGGQSSLGMTLSKRLQTETPKALYLELRAAKTKTPEHFYALAVLSDLCEPKKQMFLRWLLAGLQKFPQEPAFHNLLRAYFRAPLSKEMSLKILSNVAAVVKGDRFYSLTEPLWLQLVKQADFKTFSHALNVCEQKVRSHQISGRTVFYLQLLRTAMFAATAEWLEKIAAAIEENHSSIPDYLESEMEITFALLEYRRRMDQFRNGNSVRGHIHATFVSYCQDEDVVAIASFLDCQSRISQNTGEVLDAFPIDLETDDDYVRNAWQMVMFDVARRLWLEPDEGDQDRYVQLAINNLSELEQSESKRFWFDVEYGQALMQGFAVLSAFAWPLVFLPFSYLVCFVIGLVSFLIYGFFAFHRVAAYATRRRAANLEKAYRTRWRQVVQRMVTATNGDLRLVQALLAHFTEEEYNLKVTPFLNGFVQHDLGLQLVSDAKLFSTG